MSNPYLERARAEFDELRAKRDAILAKASEEKRDVTEDELAEIEQMRARADKLAEEIEALAADETRAAKVAALSASLAKPVMPDVQPIRRPDDEGGEGDEHTRGERLTGTAQTQPRDPGHYRKGGEYSFFGDLYRSAQFGDERATERLTEHTRALATGVAGAGVVPPRWLVEEFETLARQGRKLASAVRNISIAGDPRPITIPKQTAGTDSVVAQQASENDALSGADAWASGVDTVVPKPLAGEQTFSRQMLDMSNPAIDALIYGDLISVYNLKIEQAVGSAMVAAATTPVVTLASEATDWNAEAAYDAVIDAAMAVRGGRKVPADIIAMGVPRYGKFLKLKGTDGRPLINRDHGNMNVVGVGDVTTDGELAGLGVIVTDGINTGTYPDSIVVARASDTILFEGDVMRFRYEEVSGPQSIKIGIWAYSAVSVRYASTNSVARIEITAA